jgi:uncharacterized protein with HEPN domain
MRRYSMSDALPEDRIHLQHIRDAVSRILTYLEGVDRSGFETTPLLQDGVIRQLEIIGEAAKHLSLGFRDSEPGVPRF